MKIHKKIQFYQNHKVFSKFYVQNLITAAESLRGGDLGDKCLQSVRRLATARSGETRDDDRIASVHGLSENYQTLRNFIENSQKQLILSKS